MQKPLTQRIRSLVDEFNVLTQATPQRENGRLWNDSVLLQLRPSETSIELNYIFSYDKNKGHGALALAWLKGVANKHDVKLTASVLPSITKDGITNQKDLLGWYVRNGFKDEGYFNVSYTPESS